MGDWSSSPLIIHHEITDISSWPLELAHITTQLARPLTAIPNVPPESLSPNALEIYDELTKLPQVSVGGDNDAELPIQISDVLDTVLTSVKMLRELSRSVSHAGTPQPTLPVWRHLLGVLSLACSKDAEILADVPFLLPRTMPLTIGPETLSFEGRASLLVALYIGPKDYSIDAMEVDGTISSAEDSSGTTASKTSFMPLSGPMDGHILPGRGKRVDCVLPIICVADQDNIQALVTSTVYQKHCWGISLPTIGISIGKSSTIARLVIGWINEGHSSEEHQLPSVHLAFSSASHPSSGVFDLLNPLSALQFTRFILTMHYQFPTIAANLAASRVQDICWRLDHVIFTNPGYDFHSASKVDDWRERILQWTHDVASPESSEGGPSVILPSYISSTGSMAKTRASAANSSKPGDSEASAANSSKPGDSEASAHNSKVKTSGSLAAPSDKPSRYSASDFAKKNDALGNDKVGTEHWLWERATLRLGRIKTSGDSKEEQHMNSMIDIYDSIFALAWPPKWRKTMPPCDPIYRDVFRILFTQFSEYSKQSPNTNIPDLPNDISSFLESRISVFLSAVAIASNRAQQDALSLNVNEAETRQSIDLLIQSFCCSKEKTVSDSFCLETTIRLSKNKAVHCGIPDEAQSELWNTLASRQHVGISGKKFPGPHRVALQTQQQAASKFLNLFQSPYKKKLEVNSRSYEPPDAIADSVVCARVPVIQASHRAGSSRALEPLTPSSWSTVLRKFVPGLKNTCGGDNKKGTSTESAQRNIDKHLNCKICPFVTECLPIPSTLLSSFPQYQPNPYSAAELWIPFLLAEYKRNRDETQKAFHQCHLYLISAVDFLAALGVRDFPIFGIVSVGTEACVLMAWCSTHLLEEAEAAKQGQRSDINVIIDENLISFNLAEPLEAYRFAVSLQRIYQHQERLKELLGEVKDLEKKLESPSFEDWAMPPREAKNQQTSPQI